MIFKLETSFNSLIFKPNLFMLVNPSITTGVFPTFWASFKQEIVNNREELLIVESSLNANSSISLIGSIINTVLIPFAKTSLASKTVPTATSKRPSSIAFLARLDFPIP